MQLAKYNKAIKAKKESFTVLRLV